jgi:F-type H+-transporting ATPase subunit alpha
MQEILKQPQYEPTALEHQVMVIFAGTNGFADEVPVEHMRQWETEVTKYLDTSYPEIGKEIVKSNRITPETEQKLRDALSAFKATWTA